MQKKYIKKSIEMCSAKYADGNIMIDFKGYGITFKNDMGLSSDIVKVEYQGEINTPDFICEIIK